MNRPIDAVGYDALVIMGHTEGNTEELLVPLRQWTEAERKEIDMSSNQTFSAQLRDASMLRKITLAYAICKSVQHISRSYTTTSDEMLVNVCSPDNFVVRVSEDKSEPGWKVKGIETVSPAMVLKLRADDVLDSNFFDGDANTLRGKKVSVSMTVHSSKDWSFKAVASTDGRVEKRMCHLIGNLLRYVFTGADFQKEVDDSTSRNKSEIGEGYKDIGEDYTEEPPNKKKSFNAGAISQSAKSSPAEMEENEDSDLELPQETLRLGDYCSSAVSQLIKWLMDADSGVFSSDDAYQSLDAAINDLHLLLQEPDRFVFQHHQVPTLKLNKVKLYGRSEEVATIKTVFSRVHSSGQTEACFISGYSGCGKTRLVEECFGSVDAARGCVVTQKFEEKSTQSPLARTLSAFNDLCIKIKARMSPEDALEVYKKLKDEFGEAFKTLSRVLPNVLCFDSTSDRPTSALDNEVGHGLNYHSLCFTIQQFMAVVSRTNVPLMLVLDDLQWADSISLGLLHTVLSDRQGSSCLMFVGCYRDNEVTADHIVFGLRTMLLNFDVPITDIHLAGLTPADLNSMVCDAFSMLPRSCSKLSDIVCRKTDGSPLFAIEFLRSLVDRDLVRYSLREKQWVYDLDAVYAEDISPNVLDLILSKMTKLDKDDQSALRVESLFGIQVDASIIKAISSTPHYSRLCKSMASLVEKSFIDFNGTRYRWVHDKILEAAHGLINKDDRNQFHFSIGILLYYSFNSSLLTDESELLFVVIEQINHGLPFASSKTQQISIAELNCKAGWRRIRECNFLSAHDYMKTAVTLLPSDSWVSHYELSHRCYFNLAKAAYSCGYIDESKEILNTIIKEAKCLNDKMNAYTILVSIQATIDPLTSFKTCIEVLGYLGEHIAEDLIDQTQDMNMYLQVKRKFVAMESMPMEENENRGKESLVMYFYTQLATLAFGVKPALCIRVISKYTAYTLEHKIKSKHTPSAIVLFASLLCSSLGPDTQLGCKVGRIGMDILKRLYSTSDEAPGTILMYYGQVGVLNEQIQQCEFMHARGREIAMQNGNLYMASLNLIAEIGRALQGGTNLVLVKQEIELHLKKAENAEKGIAVQLRNAGSKAIDIPSLLIFQQVVDTLVDGELSLSESQSQDDPMMLDLLYQGRLMLCTFFGDLDNALQYAKKIQTRSLFGNLLRAFYSGLASIGVYRVNGSNGLLDDARASLVKIEYASKCSEWNYANKVLLLQAELASVEGNDDALQLYDAAIKASHSSKFLHEEALACELAGLQCKRNQQYIEALDFLQKAEICYTTWGSKTKANQMKNEMELLRL